MDFCLKFLFFCILISNAFGHLRKYDQQYCYRRDLCKGGNSHITCDIASWNVKCQGGTIIPLTQKDKALMLHAHNKGRNDIAGGWIGGYSPATHMAKMYWDEELAQLAEMNVNACRFEHDHCHNTPYFRHSGQNIYWWYGNFRPTKKAVKYQLQKGIQDWFVEYQDADIGFIRQYRDHPSGKMIGHFTLMVAENNVRVGCAAVKAESGGWTNIFLACNYATTNYIGKPTYTEGKTGSRCATGRDRYYTNLCSLNEAYTY